MNMITMNTNHNNYRDKLPDFVHIFTVEDHDYWKPLILSSIKEMIDTNNIQLNEKGYYYDFDQPSLHRPYEKYMKNILMDSITYLSETYGLKENEQKKPTYWFQQYEQNSSFGWHQHGGHWAMVYYVELPEMSEVTEFLNFGQFDIKEGDVIFFPAFLVHRSPEIKSNLRKTIISTNFEFIVNREFIEENDNRIFTKS